MIVGRFSRLLSRICQYYNDLDFGSGGAKFYTTYVQLIIVQFISVNCRKFNHSIAKLTEKLRFSWHILSKVYCRLRANDMMSIVYTKPRWPGCIYILYFFLEYAGDLLLKV